MRFPTCFCGLFSAVSLLIFCGCVTEVPDKDFGKKKIPPPDKVNYQKISSTHCKIAVPMEVKAISGTPLTIPVQLINNSTRVLLIKEWYMLDQNNFAIFYRRVPADHPLDNRTPFTRIVPRLLRNPPPRHAELQLKPANRAMFELNIPFIGELNPGEKASFEVYIATSLKTFSLKSPRFMIYAN